MIDKHTREVAKQVGAINSLEFMVWWQCNPERRKCTLEQAMVSYCSAFPGRAVPLLVELMQRVIESSPLLEQLIHGEAP